MNEGTTHTTYTTEQREGRWRLIDPQGAPFFSLGVNCVLNQYYDQTAFMQVDWVGKYGGERHWLKHFAAEKKEQIQSYGFNTLGAWHEKIYWGDHYPKTVELRLSRHAKKVNTDWGVGFPDVFDESFKASIHKVLTGCFYEKGEALLHDRGLIGYFTDNELHWWGSGGHWGDNDQEVGNHNCHLVDDYIKQASHLPGKQAWVDYLQDRYETIESLNEAWDSEYIEFDDLLHIAVYRAKESVLDRDKLGFLRKIAEVYFQTTDALLKQYDPHRLNLGCRMVGSSTPDVVFEVAKDVVDVLSLNFYGFELNKRELGRISKLAEKPMMITEFSFCAGRTAGFKLNTNGARNVIVRDQQRRAEAYDHFVREAAAMPWMIGLHWFALYDYGDPNGLIGNYGLLDLKDEPWEAFVQGVTETNEEVLTWA